MPNPKTLYGHIKLKQKITLFDSTFALNADFNNSTINKLNNMEIEIKVVMIASLATLIVALINIFVSQRISNKQNLLELKKTRIELLESRRKSIEKIWSDIKSYVIDIEGIDINDMKIMVPKMIKKYQLNSSRFLSIGYLFSKDLCNKIEELRKDIDKNTVKSRNDIAISIEEAKSSVDAMNEMEEMMNLELIDKLREIETNLSDLLN
jgi:hypothetical protein